MRDDLIAEHTLRMNALQEDRANLEQKHEKLKRSAKDDNANKDRKIADLERENVVYKEKLDHMQQKLADLQSKFNNEVHHYNLMVTNLEENQESEKKPILADLEKYRALYLQLENEKAEIMALYDRDRALWEGKFAFLQSQREQARQDLSDAMKKFEVTLLHLQKARNNDNQENENHLTDMLLSIEKKYVEIFIFGEFGWVGLLF